MIRTRRRARPSDLMKLIQPGQLSPADLRRIVTMRQAAGAVDVMLKAYVRPSKDGAAWRPVKSVTTITRASSAVNAVAVLNYNGRLAGFSMTRDMLELFERNALNPKGEQE